MPLSHQQFSGTRQSQRRIPWLSLSAVGMWTYVAVATGLLATAIGVILCWNGHPAELTWGRYAATTTNWDSRRKDVKEAFISSWDAYAKHAWGKLLMLLIGFEEVLIWN